MDEQSRRIDAVLEEVGPIANAELTGWALVAEWVKPDGVKVLTRIGSPNLAVWELKGFFHAGIEGKWADDLDPSSIWSGAPDQTPDA